MARHWGKYFPFIFSFHIRYNPIKQHCYHAHFKVKKTEAQRGQIIL